MRPGVKLPDLDDLEPDTIRVVPGVSYLPSIQPWSEFFRQSDHFAVRWSGSLKIMRRGMYTFALTSDDDSALFIDDMVMIAIDGLPRDGHDMVTHDAGVREKMNRRTLSAGQHSVQIEYFEQTGSACAIFKYQGPDTNDAMMVVPTNVLEKNMV